MNPTLILIAQAVVSGLFVALLIIAVTADLDK